MPRRIRNELGGFWCKKDGRTVRRSSERSALEEGTVAESAIARDLPVRCYAPLLSQQAGASARLVEDLQALGFRVLSDSARHVLFVGRRSAFERTFETELGVSGDAVCFVRPHSMPPSLGRWLSSLYLDKPARSLGLGDPSPQFVADHFAGKVDYGPLFDSSDNQNRPDVLFLSDVAKLVGAGAPSLAKLGKGSVVYIIDTGVDVTTPFFANQPALVDRITFLGSAVEYDSDPLLKTDHFGHGTMLAATVLSLAPECAVVMVTTPLFAPAGGTAVTFGDVLIPDILAAFDRIADIVTIKLAGSKPRKLATTMVLFAKSITMDSFKGSNDPFAEFTAVRNQLRTAIDALLGLGVPTICSVGNEAIGGAADDQNAIPNHLRNVISVGGAFPYGKVSTKPVWHVSVNSISGEVAKIVESLPRYYPDICGVEGTATVPILRESSKGFVYIKGLGKVFVCLPVSVGMSDEQMAALCELFPVTQGWLDWVCPNGDGDCLDLAEGLWCAVINKLTMPMDNLSTGDFTSQNDGWIVSTGGTSFAAATVAGALALVGAEFPTTVYDLLVGTSGNILAVRLLLQVSCSDVTGGFNAVGELAKVGIDKASGFGVVNCGKLAENMQEAWAFLYFG